MVVTFTKQNTSISSSTRGMFEYLNKENDERIDEFWENALADDLDIEAIDESKIVIEKNLFFNHDFENNVDKYFNEKEASNIIDANVSSNGKSEQSQFFMLNISPSKAEIDHMKNIADIELSTKGLDEKERHILEQSEHGKKILYDLRNDLIHQQLRDYSKDVMKNYAETFDREVYANPDKLPNQKEEREISKKAKAQLEILQIDKKSKDYSEKFTTLKQEFAKEIGKDLSTRKMTDKDLVWFGKVEEKRSYKATDKWVMQNKKTLKEIASLDPNKDSNKIQLLRDSLNKDRTTNEVVREGMLKGGDNYHVHVVISRYDNCPNKGKKISLSPLANHKKSQIGKNNDVGFNRDIFRNKVEQSFDKKFKFQRENTYDNYKIRKQYARQNFTNQAKNKMNLVLNKAIAPIKNELLNQSGINEIKKLSLQGMISKELGFRIPLKIPLTPLDAGIKIVKFVTSKIIDASKGY